MIARHSTALVLGLLAGWATAGTPGGTDPMIELLLSLALFVLAAYAGNWIAAKTVFA